MIKKKFLLIVGILILFSIPFILLDKNSLSPFNKLNSSENKITNYKAQPKSSGYAINTVWNSTKTGNVNGLAISSIGHYIVVGHDENISLFNNDANNFKKPIWTINTTYDIVDVDISGDGTYIAAIYAGNLSLFDNSPSLSKKPIWTFNTTHSVTDVAISLDGINIALGSRNSTSGYVWLFNTTNFKGKEMWKSKTHSLTSKTLVDISYNGYYIAAASDWVSTGDNFFLFNKSFPQYNIPMWKYLITWNFKSLAISNDGEFVVAAAYVMPDTLLILFNKTFSSGVKKAVWSYTSSAINDVAISYYGDSIAAGSESGYVYLFNNTPSSTVQPIWSHQQTTSTHRVKSISISGDGQYIVVGIEFTSAITGVYALGFYNSTKTTPKMFEWSDVKASYIPIYNVEISLDGRFFVSNKIIGSTFNITLYHHNIPIPPIIFSLGDDDSNGETDEPIQVPFGNYFLIFTIIALVSLIVIMKRKII